MSKALVPIGFKGSRNRWCRRETGAHAWLINDGSNTYNWFMTRVLYCFFLFPDAQQDLNYPVSVWDIIWRLLGAAGCIFLQNTTWLQYW